MALENQFEIPCNDAICLGNQQADGAVVFFTHSNFRERRMQRRFQDWWEGKSKLLFTQTGSELDDQINSFVKRARTGARVARETRFCTLSSLPFITVAAAISHDGDLDQFAIAFAAGTNLPQVCGRAFEELLQVELNTRRLEVPQINSENTEYNSELKFLRRQQTEVKRRVIDDWDEAKTITGIQSQEYSYSNSKEILRLLKDCDRQVLLIDMTHPEIGIPTTRAIFSEANENPFFNYSPADMSPL